MRCLKKKVVSKKCVCTKELRSLSKASFTAKQNIIYVCFRNDSLNTVKERSDIGLIVCVCGEGGGGGGAGPDLA